MARLPGVSDRDAGWGAKVAFYIMKRRFTKMTGRETETMLDPLRMYAHIPKLLAGYGRRPVLRLSAPNPRAARSDQAPRVDDSIPASFVRWAKLHALFVCPVAKPGPDLWRMARDARSFELGPLLAARRVGARRFPC